MMLKCLHGGLMDHCRLQAKAEGVLKEIGSEQIPKSAIKRFLSMLLHKMRSRSTLPVCIGG